MQKAQLRANVAAADRILVTKPQLAHVYVCTQYI